MGKAKELGALILFSANIDRVVSFYRAIGVPLSPETHDEGAEHYACELGVTHFAIFPPRTSLTNDAAGGAFPGFVVESVAESLEAARAKGARIRQEPDYYPWGLRAVVEDPDGRLVELFERASKPSSTTS